VIKRLRNPDNGTHVEMFLDEARLAARLNHPNIVHTYDVGGAITVAWIRVRTH
jgi:serine/threonine-protein kinase